MHTRIICTRGLIAALLLSLSFVLLSMALLLPTAHADENNESTAPTAQIKLTDVLASAISDGITAVKHEALVDESRASDFYFAQNGSGRCTITSVAMMVRRAAYLDDRPDWQDVTLSSVTSDGWSSAGVKWNFATAGYEVGIVDIANAESTLIQLLEEHPEGIAAYDPGVPHAVLLTDYDEETGTFYCADPASYYSGHRIPVTDTWNAAVRGQSQDVVISGFTRAWIVL